jgi:hypothetical protein
MYRTNFTGSLVLTKLAMVEAEMGIFQKCTTFFTKSLTSMMVAMAIDFHHLTNGTFVLFYS